MKKYNGILDYTDGSSDYLDVQQLIYRDKESIAFEMRTTWSGDDHWIYAGVAQYNSVFQKYIAEVEAVLGTDRNRKEGCTAKIEFIITSIDEVHDEININGNVNYGRDNYPFEGILSAV